MKVSVSLEVESGPDTQPGPNKAARVLGSEILKVVNRSAQKVRELEAELRPLVNLAEVKRIGRELISKFKLPSKLPAQLKTALKSGRKKAKSTEVRAAAKAARLAARQAARLRRDTLQFILNWLLVLLLVAFSVVLYFAFNK